MQYICSKCGKKVLNNKCDHCRFEIKIDDCGIVKLTDNNDFYFREKMPKPLLQKIIRSEDIHKAAYQGFKNELKWKYDFYAIDSNRGIGAVLGNLNENAVVLDYGCGWGNISKFMSNYVKEVYAMDMTYESLLFCKRTAQKNNITFIHGGDGNFLPFQENTFDLVFLNGVLEWLPEYNSVGKPQEVQINFLKNVKKILKPGGQLIIGIENRFGWVYFFGIRDEHTGLLYGTLMPRFLANAVSKLKRGKPYRTYTYSRFGYKRILKKAGFEDCEINIAFPNYRDITNIIIGGYLKKQNKHLARKKITNLKGKIKNYFVSSNLLRYCAHSYLVCANIKSGNFLQKILTDNSDNLSDIRQIRNQNHKSTVLVETERFIYKIPASASASDNLKREAEIINRFSLSGGFKRFLPEIYCKNVNNANILISKREKISGEINIKEIDDFLALKSVNIKNIRCDEIFKLDNVKLYLNYNGKEEKINDFLKFFEKASADCVFAHGDFHSLNMIPAEGGTRIIDWEFYSPQAPIEFDYINLLLFEESYLNNKTYLHVLKELLKGEFKVCGGNKFKKYFHILESIKPQVLLLYALQYQDCIMGRYENISCIPYQKDLKIKEIINLAEEFINDFSKNVNLP